MSKPPYTAIFGKSEGKNAPDTTPKMSMRAQIQSPLSRAFVLLFTWLASCSSTPNSTSPIEDSHFGKVQVSFNDLRPQGSRLTLVNETALDRADYYSTMRSTVGLKVTSNEIMNALVETFIDEDFWDYAHTGKPPTSASMGSSAAAPLHGVLLLETASRAGWITFGKGLSPGELRLFQTCSRAFIGVYNNTAGYQSVDNSKGINLFKRKHS